MGHLTKAQRKAELDFTPAPIRMTVWRNRMEGLDVSMQATEVIRMQVFQEILSVTSPSMISPMQAMNLLRDLVIRTLGNF